MADEARGWDAQTEAAHTEMLRKVKSMMDRLNLTADERYFAEDQGKRILEAAVAEFRQSRFKEGKRLRGVAVTAALAYALQAAQDMEGQFDRQFPLKEPGM